MSSSEQASIRIGFTGHQGLTGATMSSVEAELRSSLIGLGHIVGLSSLAEGSDQLFAKVVLDTGGKLVTVVPCEGYESAFESDEARTQYRSLLDTSFEVVKLDFERPSEDAFWSAGQYMVEHSSRLIAVWDGKEAVGLGGTADVVKYARELQREVMIIWPPGASRA